MHGGLPGGGNAVLPSAMVRARHFLILAFLAATFVAATTIPDTGNAMPSGCGKSVCADVAVGDACPGCKGDNGRARHAGADACATVCAVMIAVLPAPAQVPPLPFTNDGVVAYPAPNGGIVAPERAPPRPSISA